MLEIKGAWDAMPDEVRNAGGTKFSPGEGSGLNMGPSRHQLLNDALEMSRRMASFGDIGDWDAVIELEPERRNLLEQAFSTHAPADELVAERVRAILDLDKRLMAQSIEARDRVADELSQASKGRKATSAYQSAGG